jgi:hypothetical protein
MKVTELNQTVDEVSASPDGSSSGNGNNNKINSAVDGDDATGSEDSSKTSVSERSRLIGETILRRKVITT